MKNFYKVVVAVVPEGLEGCEECQMEYKEPLVESDSFGEAEALTMKEYEGREFNIVMIEKFRDTVITKD